MALAQQLAEYISAAFTGLWIQSHEHDDALAEIAQLCRDNRWKLAVWDIRVLDKWKELLTYPRTKPTKPTRLIIGETLAKNGPYWNPSAVKDCHGVLRCPDCESQLREKANGVGDFLTWADLERSRRACKAERVIAYNGEGSPITRRCGSPLWQYTGKHRVWAPANYIHQHMRGVFDFLVCDEVHEEKSDTSARANALGSLVASCKKVVATQKGCVALAIDGHKPCGPNGFANAPRLGTAQNTALKYCYQHGGKDCTIRAWICDGKKG